jgi:hypothetical protein
LLNSNPDDARIQIELHMLHQQLKFHLQSTLWNRRYAPLMQGGLDMLAGKPLEAIAAMEPSRGLDGEGATALPAW